jgi:lysophospholipase L1-like esterase
MKMKKTIIIFSLLALMTGMLSMTVQKQNRVIFFGDSITQQGVNATGYITKLKDAINQKGLSNQYELIGAGIGGNKVYDLYLRMENDVLSKNPDVVVIFIGINDVWHKATSGTGTDLNKFEGFYSAIINKLKEKNAKVIVCTPPAIGERTDYSNQQDGDLNRYSQSIKDLAKKNNIPVCDLRKAFRDYNLANNPENKESGILTVDRVHLNEKGNQLVSDLLWPIIQNTATGK